MKILLVHPSNADVYKNITHSNVKVDKKTAKTPPIGLAYIAAVLKQNNLDVEILDAEAFNYNEEQTVEEITKKKPDLVCFTVTTPLMPISIKLCQHIKKIDKNIKTVLGGPHITSVPIESLKSPFVDFVVCGEGEYTFLELAQELTKGEEDFSGVKGIGFKKDGVPVLNEKRELIQDLDKVPFPARELLPVDRYINMFNGKVYTVVISSRGCPGQCIFCDSFVTFGRRTRFRSPNNVVDELEEVKNKFGISYFTFCDDTFTLNKERTIEICKEIIRRKLGIEFYCSSRANTIDEERLEWLKKAGCTTITFGVESGDQRILNVIKKGITLEQVRNAIRLTKKYGIKTHASYMFGNPEETLETINRTIDFANELDTDFAQFCIATPYPGTELWNIVLKDNLITDFDYSKFTHYYSPVHARKGISSDKLKEIQRKAYDNYRKGKQEY